MISSRRISTVIINKFSLLDLTNANFERKFSNIIKSKIINRIDITDTYRSASIGKTLYQTHGYFLPHAGPTNYHILLLARSLSRSFFSTSRYLFEKTETMKGEGGDRADLNLEYEDIVKAQKDESVLIVDVREDEEIKETGKLPGSIHVPMGKVKDVFQNLSEQAFVDKYEKPKPSKDTKIIFSCRSGRRSANVQEEMIKIGYKKSYNYTGGWLDWESKQK